MPLQARLRSRIRGSANSRQATTGRPGNTHRRRVFGPRGSRSTRPADIDPDLAPRRVVGRTRPADAGCEVIAQACVPFLASVVPGLMTRRPDRAQGREWAHAAACGQAAVAKRTNERSGIRIILGQSHHSVGWQDDSKTGLFDERQRRWTSIRRDKTRMHPRFSRIRAPSTRVRRGDSRVAQFRGRPFPLRSQARVSQDSAPMESPRNARRDRRQSSRRRLFRLRGSLVAVPRERSGFPSIMRPSNVCGKGRSPVRECHFRYRLLDA